MKKFWKRANRGLILAGAVAVAVSGYCVVDNIRFKSGEGDMTDLINGYINDLAEAAIYPESAKEYEHDWTADELSAYRNGLVNTLDCWTDTCDINYQYYASKSAVKAAYSEADPASLDGYLTKYDVNVTGLKFSKNGPGAAKFSANVAIHLESTGSALYPDFTGTSFDYKEGEDDTVVLDSSAPLTESVSYELSGELLYENGSWKISYIDAFINSENYDLD